MQTYGRLNILWNHAGIPGPGTLETTEEEAFDRAMAINVKGCFFASKFAVPHMKQSGGGAILFTSSVSGLRASPWSPSYSLAKGGLVTLTMSLAVYLAAHNIRVNCICPGSIDSPMSRVFIDRSGTLKGEALENALRENAKKAPMNRMAKPEEIANLALFLASDESSFITGASVPIDGGKIAKV